MCQAQKIRATDINRAMKRELDEAKDERDQALAQFHECQNMLNEAKAEIERLRKKDGVISKLMNLLLILQDPSDSRFAEAVDIAGRISDHMKGSSQ